jgi:hypothetical protein
MQAISKDGGQRMKKGRFRITPETPIFCLPFLV